MSLFRAQPCLCFDSFPSSLCPVRQMQTEMKRHDQPTILCVAGPLEGSIQGSASSSPTLSHVTILGKDQTVSRNLNQGALAMLISTNHPQMHLKFSAAYLLFPWHVPPASRPLFKCSCGLPGRQQMIHKERMIQSVQSCFIYLLKYSVVV